MDEKGNVLLRQTLRCLTQLELQSEIECNKRDSFDKVIIKRLGESTHPPPEKIYLHADVFAAEKAYIIPDADISE